MRKSADGGSGWRKPSFPVKKPTLNQVTLSLMENLEQIIKIPLQDQPLEDIIQDAEGFNNSCSGAKDYLVGVRQEALEPKETKDTKDLKDLKGQVEYPSPLCKHMLSIVKTFLDESLGKILANWEKALSKPMRLDNMKLLIKIVLLGLDILHTAIILLNAATVKKQKVWEETTRLIPIFKKLNEIVLSKPSFILLAEYQILSADAGNSFGNECIAHMLEEVYKEVGKLVFLFKKTNQLNELADSLFNTLEIGLIQLIDSAETVHNGIGFEIGLTIFPFADNDYCSSLVTVLIAWNKKAALRNIGKLYQLIFIYANDAVRDKILAEIEGFEVEEMYNFMELFDPKIYEGFFEGGLLFKDDNQTMHKQAVIETKLALSKATTGKLQKIMNEKVGEELLKVWKTLKLKDVAKDRLKFIELLKIASIAVRSPVFLLADKTHAKIHTNVLEIVNAYLSSPDANRVHPIQIEIIVDVFSDLLKDIKPKTFDQVVDMTAKSHNHECYFYSAKFGNVIQNVNYEDGSSKIALEKIGQIYQNMLKGEDFLSKFKAAEGVMLTNSNPALERFTLRNEDKEVIKKLGDPSHDLGKKVGGNICKEMVGLIGGRLTSAQEESKQLAEKFKKIETDHPFDLSSSGTGNDTELDNAFKVIEEAIKKLKEGKESPRRECRKLQVKNKVGQLMGMFYNN